VTITDERDYLQVKDSRDAIADALGDLRSVLVKEACSTVTALAEVLGENMAPLADALLPILVKQLPVTILVISEASHNCLLSLFKHIHSARMIPKIIEGCKSKQNGALFHWPILISSLLWNFLLNDSDFIGSRQVKVYGVYSTHTSMLDEFRSINPSFPPLAFNLIPFSWQILTGV
jgi:hypothetical protein